MVINVGGRKHEVSLSPWLYFSPCSQVIWKLLEKRPLTRLGMLAKAKTHEAIINLVDSYSLRTNEFYFDRDPATFNCVLNFYRTDRLHVFDEICVMDYESDLEFWGIKDYFLEICCIDKFNTRKEFIMGEVEKNIAMAKGEEEVVEDFGTGKFAGYQRFLWDLFEKPQSSTAAKFLSLWSITLVMFSTVGMCLNTFEWLQTQDVHGNTIDNPKLAMIEAVCISYFSIEFLMRFAGSPDKCAFLKMPMNVVDCAAIAPFYLTLFFVPPPEMMLPDPSLPTLPPTVGIAL